MRHGQAEAPRELIHPLPDGTHEPVLTTSSFPFRRVVILTQDDAPESGAPSIRLGALARELSRHGCEVRVLTGMPNYPTGKILPGYGGRLTMRETIDGCQSDARGCSPRPARDAASSIELLVIHRDCHCHAGDRADGRPRIRRGAADHAGCSSAYQPVLRRTPYVYNTPDLQVEYADEDRWVGVRLLVAAARRLEGLLMRRALAVTTVTHAFIEHFHAERTCTARAAPFLPNGADTERLRPLPRDEALAGRLASRIGRCSPMRGPTRPTRGWMSSLMPRSCCGIGPISCF